MLICYQLDLNTLRANDAYICVSKLTTIGSDNGLSPDRRKAIIWTNDGILLIGLVGTNFSETLVETLKFSFKKMHLKVSSAKWRRFSLGLIVLRIKNHWNFNKSIRIFLQNIVYKMTAVLVWRMAYAWSKLCDWTVNKQCNPFYWYGLTLIPAWISHYIRYKVWHGISYPFLNFNGATVEV